MTLEETLGMYPSKITKRELLMKFAPIISEEMATALTEFDGQAVEFFQSSEQAATLFFTLIDAGLEEPNGLTAEWNCDRVAEVVPFEAKKRLHCLSSSMRRVLSDINHPATANDKLLLSMMLTARRLEWWQMNEYSIVGRRKK